ncbi:MAG TPA: pilus assembly protein N-terminal domain-containing protein [Vampirovibrionales bacterium]
MTMRMMDLCLMMVKEQISFIQKSYLKFGSKNGLLNTGQLLSPSRLSSLFLIFAFTFSSIPAAFADTVFLKGTAYKSGIAKKNINVGSSEVIVSSEPIKRVAITDPSVANVKILSDTSAIVMGKRMGRTTLLIWEGKNGTTRPSRFDIVVKRDISDLIARLKMLDPNIQIDYVLVSANQIEPQTQTPNSNGAFTTSYNTDPQIVGDPQPSVVVSNQSSGTPAAAPISGNIVEKITLSGKVKSAEVIAKAITLSATYMGFDSSLKVVTRSGGLIVDEVSQILSERDNSAQGGTGGSQSVNSPLAFTSTVKGNLGNGNVISNKDGSIISFLEVSDKPQISVMIRFYEVSKGIGKEFSSRLLYSPRSSKKTFGLGAGGNLAPGTLTTQRNPQSGALESFFELPFSAGGSGNAALFMFDPSLNINAVIQALESRGETKLLAEPNIVVQSGEPGRFIAGGEIPIQQAVSTLGAIGQQVTWEQFGISMNILPTITDKDSIILNVSAQNRELDPNNAFAAAGLPAFQTRRADTQVEMDPGQVLVLGGLVNNNSSRNLDKIPFIGDIPILGALARSKDFSRNDTELVVILSPEIVRSAHHSQIIRPLALEGSSNPGEFDYIPTQLPNTQRTSIPIGAPPNMPARDPVDLTRPATVNDLDQIYR